jgi:hypothetical protein
MNGVIGMEDQRLLAPLAFGEAFCAAVPFLKAGPAHQICCNDWFFSIRDIPGHHLASPDIDHKVEVRPDPTNRGGQIGDIPTPDLIRACGFEPWHCPGFLW